MWFLLVALMLTGCVDHVGLYRERGKSRFLLYEPYVADLGRADRDLKDGFIFSVITDEKIVALTFDDGPSENTEKIVSTLKRLGCPATFFLVAANLSPVTVEPYRNSLFRTEVHGHTHYHSPPLGMETRFADVARARAAFASLGISPSYFRPPYGEIDAELLNALRANGLTGMLWSLDSLDWNHLSGNDLVDRVVSNIRNGDIILCHETSWTADVLEKIITGIRAKGFNIVQLEYLLTFLKSPSPQ